MYAPTYRPAGVTSPTNGRLMPETRVRVLCGEHQGAVGVVDPYDWWLPCGNSFPVRVPFRNTTVVLMLSGSDVEIVEGENATPKTAVQAAAETALEEVDRAAAAQADSATVIDLRSRRSA